MAVIVGVRFRNACKSYSFKTDFPVAKGDGVVVETSQGVELGIATFSAREMPEEDLPNPLKSVLRVATPRDWEQAERNKKREAEAFSLGERKVAEHQLDIKLVRVEYTFDCSKVVFYFTSEGRIDFRELVKDLAGALKTRIELRQIGARDETRMLGGLGPCGLPCCCNSFLNDFVPVSIKMAKEQGLSLNPTKISGLCGRLMCCLTYEQKHYEETRKHMPRINAEVITPDGKGRVSELNLLKERVKVRFMREGDAFEVREYPNSALHFVNKSEPDEGAQENGSPAPSPAAAEDTAEPAPDFAFSPGPDGVPQKNMGEQANQTSSAPSSALSSSSPHAPQGNGRYGGKPQNGHSYNNRQSPAGPPNSRDNRAPRPANQPNPRSNAPQNGGKKPGMPAGKNFANNATAQAASPNGGKPATSEAPAASDKQFPSHGHPRRRPARRPLK